MCVCACAHVRMHTRIHTCVHYDVNEEVRGQEDNLQKLVLCILEMEGIGSKCPYLTLSHLLFIEACLE